MRVRLRVVDFIAGIGVDHLAIFFELLDPQIVVLVRPVQIDLTRTHRGERALHTNGTNVDVSNDDRGQNDTDNRVP